MQNFVWLYDFYAHNTCIHNRVPRRDLIVTKLNGAKIATAQTCWLDHRKLLLQGFRCTCNPLCGIWLRSPLYEFMLWNQPFVVTSLQKGEVVIPGANSVQGPCQWPNRPARVKKSDPGLYLWLGWKGAIWPFSHFGPLQAFTLPFTLATNKAQDLIFWPVLVGWAIDKAPAQNWPQG